MICILPLFFPRPSKTEYFYSASHPIIQDGVCVLIYCRNYPSLSWPHCWNLFPSQVYSLLSSVSVSTGILCCNIHAPEISRWQADSCVFYSKDVPRDVCCVLFIALPSFSYPSWSHLLVFHSSLRSSLLDCDEGHPWSKKKLLIWNIFKLTVIEDLRHCLESPVVFWTRICSKGFGIKLRRKY